MLKKTLIIVVLVLSTNLHLSQAEHSFKEDTFNHQEKNLEILIQLSSITLSDYPQNILGERVWGVGQLEKSAKLIKEIKIKINGTVAKINFSAFGDLFNLKEARVEHKGKEIVLWFKGGETSTSYEASMYFDKEGYLTRRKVINSEFKDQVYEETKYSHNRGEGEL